MTAIFRINQAGITAPKPPVGTWDRARQDIEPYARGGTVTFEAQDVMGSYKWEMYSQPMGVSTAVTDSTSQIASVDFTNSGPYLMRLTVDEGLPTEEVIVRSVGIPLVKSQLPIPALGELNFDNSLPPYDGSRGAADKLEVWYRWLDDKVGVSPRQRAVIDFETDPSTLTPSAGERWIIGVGAVGVWTGLDDDITEWDGIEWISVTPEEGWITYVDDLDTDYRYVYDGSGVWEEAGGGGGLFVEGAGTGSTLRSGVGLTADADYSYANGQDNIVNANSPFSMALMGGDSGSSLHNIIGGSDISPYSLAAGNQLTVDDGLNELGFNYVFGNDVAVNGSFNTVFSASMGDSSSVVGMLNFAHVMFSSIEGTGNLVNVLESTVAGSAWCLAVGAELTVEGEYITAVGEASIVRGECMTAFGNEHDCDGAFSLVLGEANAVGGEYSIFGGAGNVFSGDLSIMIGEGCPDAGGAFSIIMGEAHDGLVGEMSFINGTEHSGEFRKSLVLGEGNVGDTAENCLITGDGHRVDGDTSVVTGGSNVLWLGGSGSILSGEQNWIIDGGDNYVNGYLNRVVNTYRSIIGGDGNFVGGSGRAMSDPADPQNNAEYGVWTSNSDIISGWKNDVHSWPGEDGFWYTVTGNVVSGEANAVFSQYSVCQGKLNKVGLGGGNIVVGENITVGNVPQLLEPGPTNRTYFGKHNGALGTGALSDPTMNWTVDIWVDSVVINITDKSWGKITANTATVLTAVMADGDTDIWNWDDVYVIVPTDVGSDPQGILYTPAYSAIFGKDHVMDPYSRLNIVAGDGHGIIGFANAVFGQDHALVGDVNPYATYNLVSGVNSELENSHDNIVTGEQHVVNQTTHSAILGYNIDMSECTFMIAAGDGHQPTASNHCALFGDSQIADEAHFCLASGMSNTLEAAFYSVAIGANNNISESTVDGAFGSGNQISGGAQYCWAFGASNTMATSNYSMTMGDTNYMNVGKWSALFGEDNYLMNCEHTYLFGDNNRANSTAHRCAAFGKDNIVNEWLQFAHGEGNVGAQYTERAVMFGGYLESQWAGAMYCDFTGQVGAVTGQSQNVVSAGVSLESADGGVPIWRELLINRTSTARRLDLRENEAAGGRISVLAKRKDTTPVPGEVAIWNFDYLVDRRDGSMTVDIISGGTAAGPDASVGVGAATLEVRVAPSSALNGSFVVEVKGAANETWYWQAMISGPQLCATN